MHTYIYTCKHTGDSKHLWIRNAYIHIHTNIYTYIHVNTQGTSNTYGYVVQWVCIHTYICIRIHTYIHTYIHTHICIYIQIHVNTGDFKHLWIRAPEGMRVTFVLTSCGRLPGLRYVCMHACLYVCMYVCMHACLYVFMHACMYVCMYVCESRLC